MLVSLLVMNYLLELIMNLPNIPTIQKPNYRQFPELTMAGFADALRPWPAVADPGEQKGMQNPSQLGSRGSAWR